MKPAAHPSAGWEQPQLLIGFTLALFFFRSNLPKHQDACRYF